MQVVTIVRLRCFALPGPECLNVLYTLTKKASGKGTISVVCINLQLGGDTDEVGYTRLTCVFSRPTQVMGGNVIDLDIHGPINKMDPMAKLVP